MRQHTKLRANGFFLCVVDKNFRDESAPWTEAEIEVLYEARCLMRAFGATSDTETLEGLKARLLG